MSCRPAERTLFMGNGKVDLEDFAEFGKYWMVD
jgi:hypothetical protein